MRKSSKALSVDRIQIVTEECLLVCSCLFFFSARLLKLNFNDTLVSSTHTFPANNFNLEGGAPCSPRTKEISMPTARIELATLRFSGWNVRFSCSIRRVVSSILALGTKIFFVPGEHGFSSFQVENVHWKCMYAAHQCIIKINKNKNKINLRNHEFVRKKTKWRVKVERYRLILFFFL